MAFLLCVVLLFGCGDKGAAGPEETAAGPAMLFSPKSLSVAAGAEGSVSLDLQGCTWSFFGLSMQIECDDGIVSLADATGLVAGDLFGQDAIIFAIENDSRICLTLTRTKGQSEISDAGTIGVLTFAGLSAGTSTIRILPDKLRFYDSDGEPIETPEIELKAATITVR
ncbi:MAG: cohesin domain-containing protein [Candidatus Krumholzibacteria bacterium]|nr:cohesin domain-containing protein [Candidatus Krumholzibacteria bacterium]